MPNDLPLSMDERDHNLVNSKTKNGRPVTYGGTECNGNVIVDTAGYPILDFHSQHILKSSSYSNSNASVHCHVFSAHVPGVDKSAHRKLITAIVLSIFFITGEIVGGVMANSLAIATDAAHLTTDFLGYVINLIALHVSARPRNKQLHFGWYRSQVLGALLSILFIWAVTCVLGYLAVIRVRHVHFHINSGFMLLMALLGVVFNIIMLISLNVDPYSWRRKDQRDSVEEVRRLLGARPGDPADEQPGQEAKPDQPAPRNISVLAAMVNVVGDLVQCIGVLIAAIIIYVKPEWKLADPVCTFLFCIIVLITTLIVLRDIINVLMEAMPRGVDYDEMKLALEGIIGVQAVHNLRLWSLTVDKTAAMVHLAVGNRVDGQRVQVEAWQLLQDRYQVIECTVQVERFSEDMLDCDQCTELDHKQ